MYSTHSALYKIVHPVADHVDHFLCANSMYICIFIYLASGWLIDMEEGLAPYLKNKINFFLLLILSLST